MIEGEAKLYNIQFLTENKLANKEQTKGIMSYEKVSSQAIKELFDKLWNYIDKKKMKMSKKQSITEIERNNFHRQ